MKKMISLRKLRLLSVSVLVFLLPVMTFAQTYTVNGKVTDSDGVGIGNVSVTVKEKPRGTTTAADGSFAIKVNAANTPLIFSCVGFISKEVNPGSQTNITVSLERANGTLDDVVVIGYTQQARTKTSAAISKLNPEELKNTSNPNPVQALQGKIAGVSIPITAGQPGGGAQGDLPVLNGCQ